VIPILAILSSGLFTINQGTVGVITRLGKYAGIKRAGLNWKISFIDQILKRVSIQNRSVELEFQAVTVDQANVYFKSMLLYSVQNEQKKQYKK
jgi:regulator of protease activity HflC (stomatin/prohibitin superfamily)